MTITASEFDYIRRLVLDQSAIVLQEYFPSLADWSVRIIATELSADMLARAREGLYSQLEVNRGLPATLLVK